jgi:hypothetical protein
MAAQVTLLSNEQLERELRKAYGGRGSTSAYMLLYRELPSGPQSEAAAAQVAGSGASAAAEGGAGTGSYEPNCGETTLGHTSTV